MTGTAADDPRQARAGQARQSGQPTLSCVILTMGNRPAELERAIRSVLAQQDASVEIVVVGNGADLNLAPPLEAEVKTVRLAENQGIPGGRNAGVDACTGEVVLFLDDDGWYASTGVAAHVRDRFAADPALAVLSFRVRDPDGGTGERRHVPRLRAGDPGRSSRVTTFLGGACAIRRSAYQRAGGQPAGFFYAHEETDLAWRLMDAGYRLEYDAAAEMYHPAVSPARHAQFYRMNARNRVLLARRNLPWPLALIYLLDWVALTVLRERSPAALRAWFGGFAEGWRAGTGGRRPMSWRTAWRMTRFGRPPLI
jgi:hypothetical protein